jgi:uncharacterized repeat protein (TIGR01451 family)
MGSAHSNSTERRHRKPIGLFAIALAVVLIPASVWAQPTGPLLDATPNAGPPGTPVALVGRGFGSLTCSARLTLDATDGAFLGFADVDSTGFFTANVVIPIDTPPGPHDILAAGLELGSEFCTVPTGEVAAAAFRVVEIPSDEPLIAINEHETVPGGDVTITGTGFCPTPDCPPVTILFGGLPGAKNVPVNSNGQFFVSTKVAGGSPIGVVPIRAYQPVNGTVNEAYDEIITSVRPRNAPKFDPDRRTRPGGALSNQVLESTRGLGSSDAPQTQSPPPSAVTDVSPEPNPAEPRFGGRCLGISIDPTDVQNAYVASELGGIWRTTNGGASWSHVDAIPLTISRDTKYDPQDANIIIATGRYDAGVVNNGGIWRSGDGGASWSKPATADPACSSESSAWGIAIPDDPAFHDNIFVGTDCGVAISDDGGVTWSHVDPCTSADAGFCGAGGVIYDVEARVVGGDIQVDVCGNEGFFRSTDGGTTWSAPDPASPTLLGLQSPCHLATAPQDPDTVYIAHFSMTTPTGFCQMQLLESTTGGTAGSWVDMQIGAQNCRDGWVVTHPALNGDADKYEVYVGDAQRMRGQTCDIDDTPRCQTMVANWPRRDMGAHADPSDIAFDPASANGCPVLASNDGGMAMSADCGANWTDANAGLHALDIVGGMAGTVNNAATDLYIATQDNGIYVSVDSANNWSRPVGADGYNVEADHNPPARVFYRQCFGCANNIADPGIVGAAGFTDPPGTVPTFAIVTQFGPLSYAMLTNDGGSPAQWTAYATTDEGGTWNQLGPSPLPGRPGEIRSSGTAANPVFYLRLRVGGQWRIYSLSGALDNTATLALANNGLSIPVGAWNVDPKDANFLYAADVGTDQMMFTVDGGAQWDPDLELTNLVTQNGVYKFDSSTYRNLVTSVEFDENTDTIVVGTRTAGLYASITGGDSWVLVPGSEPLPLFRDYFFDEGGQFRAAPAAIYAATRGRGIYRILLPEADLTIEKTDNPDPVAGGAANGMLTYTVTVTNNGPDTAHEVIVVDTFPEDTLHVGDTGGCVVGPGRLLTCNVGDLGDGESASFDIMLEVSSCEPTITNEVSVSSLDPDPDTGNNSTTEDTMVIDITPPTIPACNAIGGEVDANCEFTVTFSGTVVDDCCVNTADVTVDVQLITANATLGVPVINKQQTLENRVDISGSVLVSDLTSCPATVQVTIDAQDCSANPAEQPCVATADVVDLIPPDITCPADITLDRGDKLCNTDVEDWLNSATATDNCDTDVDIVDDSASNGFACGFPYGTTTTVTWTATDDCGNTDQCSADITIRPAPRVQASAKGSVLVFSKVELRWDANGALIQDTFIDLTNDFPAATRVQLYFVNGDPPIAAAGNERAHPGWNIVDVAIILTANQPTYWSAATGNPTGVMPFSILDPGPLPGRPDPENPNERVLRGFIVAWAVDSIGQEIRWNHLKGDAAIVNYARGTAAEYTAWAFGTSCQAHGAQPLDCTSFDSNGVCCTSPGPIAGMLDMDGFQYDYGFALLVLDFYADNATAFSATNDPVTVTSDLTLHPVSADFRQEGDGPLTTKANFTVWNMNEFKLTGMDRCITCWDQTLLANYAAPNHFLISHLQTNRGVARIEGLASQLCDQDFDPGDACTQASGGPDPSCDPRDVVSEASSLLGISIKQARFNATGDHDSAAANLVGAGLGTASIQADLGTGQPPERPTWQPLPAEVKREAKPEAQ